jgi:hypothetical protein
LLLACAAVLALGLPVMAGFLDSPLAQDVQRKVADVRSQVTASLSRNVAVMEAQIGMVPSVHVRVRRLPRLKIVEVAAAMPVLPPDPAPQAASPLPAAPKVQAEAHAVAPALAVGATVKTLKQALLAIAPTGEGDPDAITCRVPQVLPASRLPGPEVCKTNRIWATLRAEGQDISADGTSVIATLSRTHALLAMASKCYNSNLMPMVESTGPSTIFSDCR